MPRGAKTIENCAGHRTKKEKESRKNAELRQLTGKKLTEFKQVRENETAHKEFQRIQKLLKVVGKDDALYSAGINRYCELVSEINLYKFPKCKFTSQGENVQTTDENGVTFNSLALQANYKALINTGVDMYCVKGLDPVTDKTSIDAWFATASGIIVAKV